MSAVLDDAYGIACGSLRALAETTCANRIRILASTDSLRFSSMQHGSGLKVRGSFPVRKRLSERSSDTLQDGREHSGELLDASDRFIDHRDELGPETVLLFLALFDGHADVVLRAVIKHDLEISHPRLRRADL